MNAPYKVHLEATKHVLHNIKGIHEFGIFYEARDSNGLYGFIDLDWAGDCEEQKSTTCYLFQLGNGPITWCSCKQPTVALSLTKAAYRALAKEAKESTWL
jgi:hypothetical protein